MQEILNLAVETECLKGPCKVYSEFIGTICTRQITEINGKLYSSSDLKDWHEDIGYLLYDGDIKDLDLSQTTFITADFFESIWKESLKETNIDDFIKYESGDASRPLKNKIIIMHIVNDLGKWGKGFVLSLSRNYPKSKQNYLKWFNDDKNFKMGEVNFYKPNDNVVIANMLAQNGVKKNHLDKKDRIDYNALSACLEKVSHYALSNRLEIQAPKLGSGLAGGNWDLILNLIKKHLACKKINCTIILPNESSY